MTNVAESYWLESAKQTYPQLAQDMYADVVIVGGGIAGLTAAYLLKQAGVSVVVLEKRVIASGVSGHTTGKITAQHNLIYEKLTRRLGADVARRYAEENTEAMERIEQIIRDENIDCDWRREGNYVYTTDRARVGQFQKEAEIAGAYGLLASFETKIDLPFAVEAAVRCSNQATFHIGKYLQGLAWAVEGNGSFVFENSRATTIRGGEHPKVTTAHGTIYAKDVIVATGVPTFPLFARLSYCMAEYPMQSYIVAGKPTKAVSGMYISPDKNHYSILPVKNETGELLLIGGEGHIPFTRFNIKTRYKRLARYAEKYFGVTTIEYQWTAYDYLGYDDMPLVGKLYPWSKHIYTATGFMKWGLTNGTMAGALLRDIILGRKNPLAKDLNPHRMSTIRSIPKVIGEKIGIIKR